MTTFDSEWKEGADSAYPPQIKMVLKMIRLEMNLILVHKLDYFLM